MYAVDGLKAVKLDPDVVATDPAAFTQNGAKHNIAVKKRDKFFISLTNNFITKKDWCKAATNGFMNKNLFKDKFLETKKVLYHCEHQRGNPYNKPGSGK